MPFSQNSKIPKSIRETRAKISRFPVSTTPDQSFCSRIHRILGFLSRAEPGRAGPTVTYASTTPTSAHFGSVWSKSTQPIPVASVTREPCLDPDRVRGSRLDDFPDLPEVVGHLARARARCHRIHTRPSRSLSVHTVTLGTSPRWLILSILVKLGPHLCPHN